MWNTSLLERDKNFRMHPDELYLGNDRWKIEEIPQKGGKNRFCKMKRLMYTVQIMSVIVLVYSRNIQIIII